MKKFNLIKRSILLVLTFFYCATQGQVPPGYYDSANGLTGDQLKAALHNIIDGHTTYPYSSSGTDVWDILKEADRDPQNPNNVIGIYSGFSMDASAEYDNGNGWNREHVWAKSRGDFGTSEGAGTDLHHLRSADITTNSARGNLNFDFGDAFYTDTGGNYSGPTLSKTSSTDPVWEPRDAVKGDVARMIFYMAVRYEGTNGEPDLELTDVYQSSTSKSPLHAKISTLIQWHLSDPVDGAETSRNDIVYGYQQNRNPFIDHPEYVCEIYPAYCSPSGNNAPYFTSSPVISGEENQLYSYSISTTDADGDPISLTASVKPNWLSLTDNGNGTGTLTGTPGSSDTGSNAVTLNVSDGTASTDQSFNITVNAAGGGGSTELFFSEYIEGSSYNKGLEIANFTGASVDLSSYSIQKQSNGSGSWGSSLQLTGSITNGNVYVVVNANATSAMQSVADLSTTSGAISFNGNDAVGLFKNGTLIDIIGTFNSTSYFGQNVTLIRNSTISSPNTSYTTSEWSQQAQDSFVDLGSHTFDGSTSADTEAPTTPSNLTATNIAQTTADLSWSASTDNVGVASYEVYIGGVLEQTTVNTSQALSGLTAATTYNITVNAKDDAGNTSGTAATSFTTASYGMACTSTEVSSYAFGFESGLGSWTDVSGDFSWTRDSGGTPSSNTGPSSAFEGSYYLYAESSTPNYSYKTAIVQSPCFDLASESAATFSFRYHMYGATNMGSLTLRASTDDNTWSDIWTQSGTKGNNWLEANVDLSAYLGGTVKLRFVSTTGNTWQGDVAVDDISFTTGAAPNTDVALTLVFDNYPEETSWEIKQGSTVIVSGGTYGTQPDGSTLIENASLPQGCYDFIIYDTYGDGICCSYGSGSYQLTEGSTILASGGSFASSELTNFCLGSGSARIASSGDNAIDISRNGFSIYPNPGRDQLTIETGKMGAVSYTIIDAAGKVKMAGVLDAHTENVNISNLKSGFYFFRATDGENTLIRKFVKE